MSILYLINPLQRSCLENLRNGGASWAAVYGVAQSRTRLSNSTFTFHFHALEKEMATHSSVLAWRIPGTGEPHGLLSMGSHRVSHDWSDLAAAAYIFFHWPGTPVCFQLVFCVHFCVWRCVPDVSVERDALHVHLLLHHLVLLHPHPCSNTTMCIWGWERRQYSIFYFQVINIFFTCYYFIL